MLLSLKKHHLAPQFVNQAAMPSYPGAVSNPVDLNILEQRLKAGTYTDSGQFIADGRKIWENTLNISKDGTDLYNAGVEMSDLFENLIRNLGVVPLAVENVVESKSRKGATKSGVARSGNSGNNRKAVPERPMSSQEKALLRHNIMRLSQDKLQGVIQIIQSSVDTSKSRDTLEFDIDKLPTHVSRELDQYVRMNLPDTKRPPRSNEEPTLQTATREVKLCGIIW